MGKLSLLVRLLFLGLLALAQFGSGLVLRSKQVPLGPSPIARPQILQAYGRLPLSFEANWGQTDSRVKFLSRGRGYTVFLTATDVALALRGSRGKKDVVRVQLVGANPEPLMTGLEELPGKSNYLIGNDPKKWRTNVPNYAKVRYRDVYPGIDLVYYGHQRQLEFDFVIAPGADPNAISMAVGGAADLRMDESGGLVLRSEAGEIRFGRPKVYQWTNGGRKEIPGGYAMVGKRRVRFRVASYDASKVLVIDPTLVYSTYLGGSAGDQANGIAVDASGNAYVAGITYSPDFPTVNPVQAVLGSSFDSDAFVAKLNSSGSALVYSTYLGGNSDDSARAIALDGSGNAYITGFTYSANFPTTPGAFQTALQGFAAFVAKLNAAGTGLIYSTFLGRPTFEGGFAIAVDGSGNAYVTGQADFGFPTTPGAFRSCCSGIYATKLNPLGTALVYSTYLGGYLGGIFFDSGRGIAVDAGGNAYVTGVTSVSSFPTTPGAFQTTIGGSSDAFVTKLNPTGASQVYSTFLGGTGSDTGVGIAVDSSGNAYVTGYTTSTDFPTRNGAQAVFGGANDAFVSKLSADGTALVFSTFLGGNSSDQGNAIATDAAGNTYVAGTTSSTNFPITAGAFKATLSCCSTDAFVTKLSALGVILYSSYLGGSGGDAGNAIAVDSSSNAYVAGSTTSSDFPTVNPLQAVLVGFSRDSFVSKIAAGNPVPALNSLSPVSAAAGGGGFALTVNGSNFVTGAVVRWNGADRPTTFLSSSQLTASIPPSDIASAGTAQVTVLNPPPGGGLSNPLTFTIVPLGTNPIPTVSSLSPTTGFAGGTSFTLFVAGLNFVQTSVVRWNGSNRVTTFSSSTQLFATIPASDIAASGTAQVTVFNPTPGGGLSNAFAFAINASIPVLTLLTPDYATAGGTALNLTLNGSGFIANSVVRWNGSDRGTTFVSSNQLQAVISAADIAAAGTAQVAVFNPAPGGGLSSARPFSVLAPGVSPVPVLSSLSPTGAVAGGTGFTLTVNGLNFVSASIVRWNGADRATTFMSSTQLRAAILASDITVSGSALVTVFNPAPGGGTSNSLTFTIFPPGSNPVPVIDFLSPSSATAGGTGFTLTVNGSGFLATSVVRWNGSNRTTAFLGSTQVQATISAGDIFSSGTRQVTVFNPSPGGGSSNVLDFTINPQPPNPIPALSSLSPSGATVGGAGFTLIVSGSNFLSGSVVRWNGSNRSTTFLSSTQLRASIAAGDIATVRAVQVTVFNPTPGGGTSNGLGFFITTPPGPNPAPTLSSLSPSSATGGGPAFTLTVTGSDFVFGAVVRWNGLDRPTTFVSDSQLTASIPDSDISAAGTAQVAVFNPSPGGGVSNALAFTINRGASPAPVLSSLSPASATAGGPAFTLTAAGSGFVPESVVRWNAADRNSRFFSSFVSSSQLTASIPASDISAAGAAQVTVFSPAPGGGTSEAMTFLINNPAPAITSLSPLSATAGGAGFILTINGSGFVSSSVVRWNGSDRDTGFVSGAQLTATIPSSDLLTAGTAQVTVFNPGPGGGTSAALSFSMNSLIPALSTLAPSSAPAGSTGLTLTLSGSNFFSGSVVRWNGTDHGTTFLSSAQLQASIPGSDLAAPGTAQVTVFNPPPGGGISSALTFNIQLPPLINPVGLLNGASFSNSLGSGSLATLFSVFGPNLAPFTATANSVPLPTTLADTIVRLDGIPAPLLFVSPFQINFQIPWELLGRSQAVLTISVQGVPSNAVTVNLAAYSPALFSINQRGSGQGAIVISGAGGALAAPAGAFPNARPVRRGEFVEMYAIGLGPVSDPPPSGAPSAGNPLSSTTTIPTVTIGGVPAKVSFSGLSPGFVGLYQVNVQIPEDTPTGDTVPVVLTIGGAISSAVTIAVQ